MIANDDDDRGGDSGDDDPDDDDMTATMAKTVVLTAMCVTIQR